MAVVRRQIVRWLGREVVKKNQRSNDQTIKRSNYLLSWSYWFGSRTQGLLVHPYVTMREIVREHFLRPLVVLPIVVWIMSWVVGVVVGRLGLWLDLGGLWWTVGLGRILVFGWIWVTTFLMLWQVVLMYLYVRFQELY